MQIRYKVKINYEVVAGEVFKNEVELDNNGYIVAVEDCVTSAGGFYAAGDVRTKQLRQVITAAADGANAASQVIKYLK